MIFPRGAFAALFVAALGSAACAVESAASPENSGGGGGSGGALVSGGGGSGTAVGNGGAPTCPSGPGYDVGGTPQLVSQLSARIIDQLGAPAAKVPVLVCGFGGCGKLGSTSDQGEVCALDQGPGFCSPGMFPNVEITRPSLKYGLGIHYVKFAQPLPASTTAHAVGDITTVRLPDPAQGVVLVPGESATSGGVTLTLDASTVITIDELVFDEPVLQKFRAVEVPVAKAPPAVDKSAGFEILVGTTPVETLFCPPAKLSVPNTAAWTAGTEVEFWVHGVSLDETWAPYGGWGKISNGRVSDDGSRVVTNDGEGVPMLSVIGIKKR